MATLVLPSPIVAGQNNAFPKIVIPATHHRESPIYATFQDEQALAGQTEADDFDDQNTRNTQSDSDFVWENETLPDWLEESGFEENGGQPQQARSEPGQQPQTAPPQSQPNPFGSSSDPLRVRRTLTGDWNGRRNCWLQRGVVYRGRMTQFFFGVDGGIQEPVPAPFAALGIEGGDTFEYTGNSQHDFFFDLEKFGGPQAGKFIFTMENLWGRFGNVSLETGASSPTIFNSFFPVDEDANGVLRVTNMLYVQPLSERFIVSAGKARLAGTADRNIFAGGDGSDQFLNQTFVANPLFFGQLPLSTFSLGAIMPKDWGNISVSVIDPIDRSTQFFDLGDLFAWCHYAKRLG